MGLQSLQYCAFLVVVAAVYLHLPVRMQPVFLLGASWVFYALAMPAMLPVTIALAVFTYLCGRGLAWRGGAHKTAFLRLGVIGMLGILARAANLFYSHRRGRCTDIILYSLLFIISFLIEK